MTAEQYNFHEGLLLINETIWFSRVVIASSVSFEILEAIRLPYRRD